MPHSLIYSLSLKSEGSDWWRTLMWLWA